MASRVPVLFGSVSESERKLRTLRSLTGVFQTSLRILSGKADVICTVTDQPHNTHAAWTEYPFGAHANRVMFNLPHVGSINTSADIVRLTGLAHHERCHLTYTPAIANTKRDPIGRVFVDRGEQADYTFNVLEDQRIESMDVAMLPSMRHYYSATVAGYVLNGDENQMKLAWLLVYGRRYLGTEVIEALESAFKFPEHIAEIKRIIDSFRKLNLFQHGDKVVAGRLLEELCDLLFDQMQEQPDYSHPQACQGHGGAGGDSDQEQAAQGQAKLAAQEEDDEDDEDDEEGEGGGGSGSGDDDEEDDDDDSDGDGGDGEDGEDEDGDDSDSDSPSDGGASKGGQGAGSGTRQGDEQSDPVQDAINALADALNQAVNDPAIQQEVQSNLQATKNGAGRTDITKHNGWEKDTRPDAVLAARALSKRLERMRDNLDPGWESNLHSGRLDMQAAIRTRDPLADIWQQWNEGKVDATDVETVVIVDQSGSMGDHERALSDAAWSIKHGHDKIGASCTVWGFDTQGFLIYGANDKAVPGIFPNTPALGGTEPSSVIVEAARILDDSKRKRKMFIVMTDGMWGGYGVTKVDGSYAMPNDVIAQMNGAGILTAMVYLTGGYDMRHIDVNAIDWHNTQIHRLMGDLSGFGAFGDELLRKVMSK